VGYGKSNGQFIKKKIEEDLERNFPDLNPGDDIELYVQLSSKIAIQLKYLTGKADEREKLKPIDDYFYEKSEPKKFWGSDGFEVQHDKEYESTCGVMEQHLSRDPKSMTVFEYYSRIEELKKKFKPQQ
jgi:hypothetical protein